MSRVRSILMLVLICGVFAGAALADPPAGYPSSITLEVPTEFTNYVSGPYVLDWADSPAGYSLNVPPGPGGQFLTFALLVDGATPAWAFDAQTGDGFGFPYSYSETFEWDGVEDLTFGGGAWSSPGSGSGGAVPDPGAISLPFSAFLWSALSRRRRVRGS